MIHVGTSGWQYRDWRGILYPPGLATKHWLERYASIFSTVELNNTFYKLPTAQAVDRWRDEAPDGFLFACKGSRFLTHMKRLTETGEGIRRYFDLVERLGPKLGPVLWQLPPQMNKADLPRLDRFLAALPGDIRYAVEFRHEAWYTRDTCDVLDEHGAAFVEHDLVDRKVPRFTGGFRYLRFHGTSGKYAGRYGREALRPVARSLTRRPLEAFVYFNNDTRGHALYDAFELTELLGEPLTWEPASPDSAPGSP